MKSKLRASFPVRRVRERILASALALAVIIASLKLAGNFLFLVMGASVGALMLATALTTIVPPSPQASWMSRLSYLLAFGIVDAMATLDELTRMPRL